MRSEIWRERERICDWAVAREEKRLAREVVWVVEREEVMEVREEMVDWDVERMAAVVDSAEARDDSSDEMVAS